MALACLSWTERNTANGLVGMLGFVCYLASVIVRGWIGTKKHPRLQATSLQPTVTLGVVYGGPSMEVTMRGFVIGALVVAVGVLGYLYWDSQHNTVFKAPGIEIKKN